MTHAVPTEPERLMRRLPRNSRHGLSPRPTGAVSGNSTRPAGREGGDGFTEPETHASLVPAGTTQTATSGRGGLIRTGMRVRTSTDRSAVAQAFAEQPTVRDGRGGRWKAPRTQNREV